MDRLRAATRLGGNALPRTRLPTLLIIESWSACFSILRTRGLQRLQILHQIAFLLIRQMQRFDMVVVVDYIEECGEAAIVIKPSLGVGPKPLKRRCAIPIVRGARGLKIVDTDFLRGVHIPSRL